MEEDKLCTDCGDPLSRGAPGTCRACGVALCEECLKITDLCVACLRAETVAMCGESQDRDKAGGAEEAKKFLREDS